MTYFTQNFDFGTKFCPLTSFIKCTVNFNKIMVLMQGVFNQPHTINCFCDSTYPRVLLEVYHFLKILVPPVSARQRSCGKVLFSVTCVCYSVHKAGGVLYRALAQASPVQGVRFHLRTGPDPSQTCSNLFTMYPILSSSGLLAFY